MRSQKFIVEFVDGREPVEVTVDGRDYLFYEEESGENSLDLLVDGQSMRTWYTAACAGMRRQGLYEGLPEQFKDEVAFVVPVRDAVVDPTPATPKEGGDTSS